MATSIDMPAHATGVHGLRDEGPGKMPLPSTTSPPSTDTDTEMPSNAASTRSQTPDSPPPAPNPSQDIHLIPQIKSPPLAEPPASHPQQDENMSLHVDTISPETAMRLLARTLEALALVTGDICATPAASIRPVFGQDCILGSPRSGGANADPSKESRDDVGPPKENRSGHARTTSKPEIPTPIPDHDLRRPSFSPVQWSSPEASTPEPPIPLVPSPSPAEQLTRTLSAQDKPRDDEEAEPKDAQNSVIARKFFSKSIPPISLGQYLVRLHQYCPMSTAVWLAAAYYISILCLADRHAQGAQNPPVVPLTPRTVHRLMLAALRVAMKALEDLRYPQARFAGVGGVSEKELKALEISLCYLLDFDLQVNCAKLVKGTVDLQRASAAPERLRMSMGGGGAGGFHVMEEGLALTGRGG